MRKTFTIHRNDAGTEAYRDQYVHGLEAEIARLRDIIRELRVKAMVAEMPDYAFNTVGTGPPKLHAQWLIDFHAATERMLTTEEAPNDHPML